MAEPETLGPQSGLPLVFRGDQVSLFDLNTAEGKKRIQSGAFSELHRGSGAFNPAAHAEAELQAFRNLLGEDILSYNLRQLYASLAAGEDPAAAYRMAKQAHAKIIAGHFEDGNAAQRKAIFQDLFANEGRRASTDNYNHEADFIFATKRADIAGCYGPVVVVIRERQPRGLDLNRIAAASKYYNAGRFFKNAIRLRWKTMVGDYILDDDEYLLPSYVSAAEVSGIVVRSPKAKVISSHVAAADKDFSIALKAPPILRRYEKKMAGGFLTIDVFDGKNQLIAHLSESQDAEPPAGMQKSPETLPAPIQTAWNAYLQKVRH